KIFIITDSIGSTSGPSGTGSSSLTNRGAILVYHYIGAVLSHNDRHVDRETNTMVRVYPNPASDRIQVEVEKGLHKPIHYTLYDLTGKVMTNVSTSKNTFVIDVAQVIRGMYILKITDGFGQQVMMQKVVLQ